MMTARPELFLNNPDPTRVMPIDDDYVAGLRRLGARIVQPYYVREDPGHPTRDLLPSRHIIAEMCALAGLTGEITLRPYLHLGAAERSSGRHFPRQIVLQSSVLAAAIPYDTKEWGVERMAAVARELRSDAPCIQIGSARDAALPVALDLRGKTSLRESAALLAAADLFIGPEGFLAHLARAVDCPAVVVAGGRAPLGIFTYAENLNLGTFPDCAPCGLRTGCPHALRCLTSISTAAVVAAARELLSTAIARPLPHQTAYL
jgi:ADP-heptose:LPS heptosyltransferase